MNTNFETKYINQLTTLILTNSKEIRFLLESNNRKHNEARLQQLWEVTKSMIIQKQSLENKA